MCLYDDMRERPMGSEGPPITVIGYGAWEAGGDAWGPNESEASVIEAIHAGLDAGMSWIDTAEVYGKGVSETLVGKAVADRRDQALLFTKVGPIPGRDRVPCPADPPRGRGLAAAPRRRRPGPLPAALAR